MTITGLQTQQIPYSDTGPISPPTQASPGTPVSGQGPRESGREAFKVEISPRAREMSAASMEKGAFETPSAVKSSVSRAPENRGATAAGAVECQTCKNRTYQDGSDDPSVSFQSATHIDPDAAESLVRSHEQEHVSHEQVRAKEKGSEVVSQHVAIHYQTCPECGRSYVAGGTTTTVTRSSVAKNTGSGASGNAGGRGVNVFA